MINDGNISLFEREKLCEALGKSVNLDIYRDSINSKHSNTNMEKTAEIDSHTYLMSFYRPSMKLLVGMADISLNSTTSPKKMHALCLAVEQIHYTRNLTFIGPFSFSNSLVKWSLHGSKSSHALDGCSYRSGSVTTLQKFSSQDENVEVVMLRYGLITHKERERPPESGRMGKHLSALQRTWFLHVPTLLVIYRRYMNCLLDIGVILKKISLY